MARIILECSGCQARYDIRQRPPGSLVRCKHCQNIMTIPKPPAKKAATRRARVLRFRPPAVDPAQQSGQIATEALEVEGVGPEAVGCQAGLGALISGFGQTLSRSIGRLTALSWALTLLGLGLGFGGERALAQLPRVANWLGPDRVSALWTGLVLMALFALIQGAAILIGVSARRSGDDDRIDFDKGWFRSLWMAFLGSVKAVPKILGLELLYLLPVSSLLLTIRFLASQESALGPIAALILLIFGLPAMGVYGVWIQLAMAGLVFERRPFGFALRRAWAIFSAAWGRLLLVFALYAPLALGLLLLLQLGLGALLFGGPLASFFILVFARALQCLLAASVYHELCLGSPTNLRED